MKNKSSPQIDENTKPNVGHDMSMSSKKHSKDSEEKHRDKKKEKSAPKTKQEISEEAHRLKDLAKKCGLHVPPSCFKGNPDSDELEERIGKFLLSSGLKVSSHMPCTCYSSVCVKVLESSQIFG